MNSGIPSAILIMNDVNFYHSLYITIVLVMLEYRHQQPIGANGAF